MTDKNQDISCPKCKKRDKIDFVSGKVAGGKPGAPHDSVYYLVYCNNCGYDGGVSSTQESAIEKFNTKFKGEEEKNDEIR
ncbi:MAG TPA: hypothetical protein ENH82_11080 [bacterium]|nr:hypothetical protein [bacterium]